MLNKKQNLNKDIFSKEVERESTREGYGRGLLEIGKKNKNIVALSADLTHSTYTHFFADEFPERFFQVGVAEQNMASVASGMSAMGKIPFIASYSIFDPAITYLGIYRFSSDCGMFHHHSRPISLLIPLLYFPSPK